MTRLSDDGIFNFGGFATAKVINPTPPAEPVKFATLGRLAWCSKTSLSTRRRGSWDVDDDSLTEKHPQGRLSDRL